MNFIEDAAGLADDAAIYRFLCATPIVPLTICAWSSGEIAFANDAAARLFGAPAADLLGRSIRDFYVDLGVREQWLRQLERNGGTAQADLEMRRADGAVIWVAVSAGRILYRGVDAIIAVINDITQQKVRETELAEAGRKLRVQAADLTRLTAELRIKQHAAEAANAAKSSFLAHMSHELRSPLNAILGFAEVVRDQHFGPEAIERYSEYGGYVHQAGTHLLDLIDDILDLAKVEAGKLELLQARFNLADLLDESARIIHSLAERRGVSFKFVPPPPDLALTADRRRAKQMVVNLLSNAIKFTPAGGRVELEAHQLPDGGTVVVVADTGVGMTPEQILLALEPFGRIEGSGATDPTGTGLGLPIVRNLIEAHGGKLQIVSEPGRGTVVRLLFPFDAD